MNEAVVNAPAAPAQSKPFNLAVEVKALPCVVPNHDGVPYNFTTAYQQGHEEALEQVSQMLQSRAASLRDQLEHLMLSFAAQSANHAEEYRALHHDGNGSQATLDRHSQLADKAMAKLLALFGLPEESTDG